HGTHHNVDSARGHPAGRVGQAEHGLGLLSLVYLAFCFALHFWIGVTASIGALVLFALTLVTEFLTRKPAAEALYSPDRYRNRSAQQAGRCQAPARHAGRNLHCDGRADRALLPDEAFVGSGAARFPPGVGSNSPNHSNDIALEKRCIPEDALEAKAREIDGAIPPMDDELGNGIA